MNLTYETHHSIKIDNGKISVIGTNNRTVYMDFINAFSGNDDQKIHLFNDKYEELELNRNVDWIGDLMEVPINSKYSRQLIKQITENLTDNEMNELHEINRKLYTLVQKSLFMVDLPLKVTPNDDLKNTFKYANVHFDSLALNNPYDKLSSIIKLHLECHDLSIIGLTNASHYLDGKQITEIESLCNSSGISLIMLEFNNISDRKLYPNCLFNYIDRDFVDWY
ncbi:hypothetical protein WR164_14180 [Philodulcilactobacillus myokoensis]|uniref:Type II-A CRISPR-associated protein Csn2 n=1 Tax=Philodulcilactobacillus myokoensis TaxID=2929573 RepID=A0A9W6EUE2_9LACO|nr:type II-A CRISPR-associated protein Csn2 [Philodulcilactobacillus myokoensis]GLB47439.1 hypothetical protein WR164_14180 [Philodulcilactobacillus myokoensis]